MPDLTLDLDLFFEDFGVDLTIKPGQEGERFIERGGLLDQEIYEAEAGGRIVVLVSDPKLTMRTSDASELSEGDEVVIHPAPQLCQPGATFHVLNSQPDGTGMSIVELSI